MHLNAFRNLAVACAATVSSFVFAAPVPADLSLSGQVAMDVVFSLDPTGTATQAGTLSAIAGGNSTAIAFTDTPSSLTPSSLSGGLLSTGNGFGARFSMSGSSIGPSAQTDGLFADFSFSLSNLSATLTYTLIFHASVTNSVSASGQDAFAFSDISIMDSLQNELFFSDFRADTVNAGSNFLLNSASNTFSVTLLPGQNTSFSALQRQRGGAFASGSAYSASLDTFISLQEIRSSGGNNDVPTPGSLALLIAGAAALWTTRRPLRH